MTKAIQHPKPDLNIKTGREMYDFLLTVMMVKWSKNERLHVGSNADIINSAILFPRVPGIGRVS